MNSVYLIIQLLLVLYLSIESLSTGNTLFRTQKKNKKTEWKQVEKKHYKPKIFFSSRAPKIVSVSINRIFFDL